MANTFYNTNDSYLELAIPLVTQNTAYYNAEIYNSAQTKIEPKNIIPNPGIVDLDWFNYIHDLNLNLPYHANKSVVFSANVKATVLEGGSRGWGFWNTSANFNTMQTAWFMHSNGKIQDGSDYALNGLYAFTQNGTNISYYKLPDLDENKHTYQIEMTTNFVRYSIDNKCVFTETRKAYIPNGYLSFHNWVDNAVFGSENVTILGIEIPIVMHILQKTTGVRKNTMDNLMFQYNQ